VQEHSQFVGRMHALERDFAQFDTSEYHDLLLRSLANAEAVLVHNPLIAAALEPYAKVRVVPIGVDANSFGAIRPLETAQGGQAHFCSADSAKMSQSPDVKRILFAGRTGDLVKGFQVLRAAGETLWRVRQDFRVVATGEPKEPNRPFIEWMGWRSHAEMPTLLAEADMVAAPAIASEPFGLTVVEAMAAARPVVASRVGGQQFTVVHGVTGLLCEPDDPVDLAEKLSMLLDSVELRLAMGNAGRRRFLTEYAWDVVIDRYYRPLLRMRTQSN
jgi:glycosyltransferase involved in cell wall biosynthesis